MGTIKPIHKKGPRENAENYRPVTNICSLAKIFEKCILVTLNDLQTRIKKDLTGSSQHGFKKGKSTITAASEIKRRIIQGLQTGGYVGVLSLDLSSAFDVVNHELLIKKLNELGIPSNIVTIISSWLKSRTCVVQWNGKSSTPFETNEGTVQGSVLGPILFSLYISQLLTKFGLICYADDSYLIILGPSPEAIKAKLEIEGQQVINWLKSNGLKVNIKKTECVIFQKTGLSKVDLNLDNSLVQSQQSMKILGIHFDNNLTWSHHVEKIHEKVVRSTYGLKYLRKHLQQDELLKVARSTIFPQMYYGEELFLMDSLKNPIKKRLLSISTMILKSMLDFRDWTLISYKDLHQIMGPETPMGRCQISMAMQMYDAQQDIGLVDTLSRLELSESRTGKSYYVEPKTTRIGKQLLENQLSKISKIAPVGWKQMSRHTFKKAMIRLINIYK